MTMKELRQAVPVYINGPSNGLCETTYLFDNEPEELGAQQQHSNTAAASKQHSKQPPQHTPSHSNLLLLPTQECTP